MENNNKDGFVVEPIQFTEEVDLPQNEASQEAKTEQVILQDEIKPRRGWNFGAFTFPFIWCLCNGCIWPAIVLLIPGINQIFRFFLGGFGNRWAWMVYGDDRTGEFNKQDEVERFNKIQKGWNIAGIIVLSIVAVCVVVFW